MKLTTKGRYGLRAMLDIATNFKGEPIPLKEIANRQDISEHYLEQLMSNLRKNGLVNGVRGVQGGYTLAKKPSKITVGDILRALEGPIGIVECVLEEDSRECIREDICVTRIVWEKIRDSIINTVDSITLQDLCDLFKQKLSKQ